MKVAFSARVEKKDQREPTRQEGRKKAKEIWENPFFYSYGTLGHIAYLGPRVGTSLKG